MTATMAALELATSSAFRPSADEFIMVRTLCRGAKPLVELESKALTPSAGMFVSESKFREHPADFVPHILTPNPRALEQLITKPAVEEALLRRLERKALWYGRELDASGEPGPSPDKTRIEIDQVVRLYRDYIIPLTKDVEVSSSAASRRVCTC